MKKLWIIAVLMFLGFGAFSQSGQKLPTLQFLDSASYKITGYKLDEELKYRFDISVNEQTESFTLETTTESLFVASFISKVQKLSSQHKSAEEEARLRTTARQLFYNYIASSKALALNKEPVAGDLILNRQVEVSRALGKYERSKAIDEANQLWSDATKVKLFQRRKHFASMPFDSTISGWHSKRSLKELFIKHSKDSLTAISEHQYGQTLHNLLGELNNLQKLEIDYKIQNQEYQVDLRKFNELKRLKDSLKLEQISFLESIKNLENPNNSNLETSDIPKLQADTAEINSNIEKLKDSLEIQLPKADPVLDSNSVNSKDRIKQLQECLVWLNYNIPITGNYLTMTTALIKRIQQETGEVAPNGSYGEGTYEILNQKMRIKKFNIENSLRALQDSLDLQLKNLLLLKFREKEKDVQEKIKHTELRYPNSVIIAKKDSTVKIKWKSILDSKAKIAKGIIKLNKLNKQLYVLPYKIDSIQIEFKSGYIENMLVVGNLQYGNEALSKKLPDSLRPKQEDQIKFDNQYPIGFSRKRDYQYLISGEYPRLIGYSSTGKTSKKKEDAFYLPTRAIIQNYLQNHAVGRRDFSPKDQVKSIVFTDEPNESIRLVKKMRKKLFEAHVFSDFIGLDESKENGLIQTSISKQLNIVTKRFPRLIFGDVINWGIIPEITPSVTISKLEETNKHLPISYRNDVINLQYRPARYVESLHLRSYENFNTGFDITWGLLDVPSLKSTFCLSSGMFYGRVALVDSTRRYEGDSIRYTGQALEIGANTWRIRPVLLTWRLQTVEDFQFDFNWSVNYLDLRHQDIYQVGDEALFLQQDPLATSQEERNHKFFFRTEFNAQWNPPNQEDSGGKLFFRYRFFWQNRFWNTSFHQAQVGYSFYLMK
ncbi:hypothetical protein [Marinoscillum furvescens]|uniref:Peptidoglycan binding protein n=1 Tax=Marinoscillum furvescens DSM 4134 TaxID=1122208 RepID=A0A3D9L3C4_MARFU|nr:hypothetical protein [Marinoscillum furvescens]RED97871.1 hypothetical protein C7460_11112 [Marinoscillum furvescens DSM 4134]